MASPLKKQDYPRLTDQVRRTILSPMSLLDPVGKQYVPDARESIVSPEEDSDPIGDDAYSPLKGIVHRYPDRVLLKITDICSVYCRFCFRKEMVGQGAGMLSGEEIEAALAYVRADENIREVILTGGDPLTLSNRRMAELFARFESIPHLDIIRIHTRSPIVQPQRVDDELTNLCASVKKALYVVLHVNHAQEIDVSVEAALQKLARSGAVLLSQSVLLKDVNDDAATLEALFRKLLANRVKPYYLHHPDLAPGTSHFRVSIKKGQDIMKVLRGRLSGLGYPTYVLDLPGGYGKMPLTPDYVEELEGGTYRIEDYRGEKHLYPPKGKAA
ncbi:MAG TPA: lysine-2,3-aminomutase-like protein [Micavibrio sp.]|nr:lysine-2,3-aminomutase-like protein [Micavibrio sp.]